MKYKIGFTCGTFDLCHAGHMLMFEEVKNQCDHLIVGLQNDPSIDRPTTKNKPVQSIYERFSQVSSCKYVDEVLVYSTEEDLFNILKTQHINIRFLGDEYKTKPFTGKQWCLDNDVELHYHLREHPYSSSALRKRVYEAERSRMGMISNLNDESPRSLSPVSNINNFSGFNGITANDIAALHNNSKMGEDLGYTK